MTSQGGARRRAYVSVREFACHCQRYQSRRQAVVSSRGRCRVGRTGLCRAHICVRRRRSLPLRRLSHPHSSTICQRSRGQDLVVMVTDPVYIAGDCLNVWLARNTLQRLSGVARGGAVGAAAPQPRTLSCTAYCYCTILRFKYVKCASVKANSVLRASLSSGF